MMIFISEFKRLICHMHICAFTTAVRCNNSCGLRPHVKRNDEGAHGKNKLFISDFKGRILMFSISTPLWRPWILSATWGGTSTTFPSSPGWWCEQSLPALQSSRVVCSEFSAPFPWFGRLCIFTMMTVAPPCTEQLFHCWRWDLLPLSHPQMSQCCRSCARV